MNQVERSGKGDRLVFPVLALLVLAVLIPFSGQVSVAESGRLLEKGEWTVSGTETITSEEIILTGNLTIAPNGRLRLVDTDLIMNLSDDGQFAITVEDGGTLELENATIRTNLSSYRYTLSISGNMIANSSVLHNFNIMGFDGATVDMNGTEIVGHGDPVISAVGSDLDLIDCTIVVKGGGEGLVAVNSTITLRASMVRSSGPIASVGLNISGTSDVTVQDGGIYDISTGILFKGRDLEVDGALFEGADVAGVEQWSGNSTLLNGRFVDLGRGLLCHGGSSTIRGNDLQTEDTAIELVGCNGLVENNVISGSEWAINVTGPVSSILNNTIRDNTNGLHWNGSNMGRISGNLITNNERGALIEDSTISIEDGQFLANVLDIELVGSDLDLVNTTHGTEALDPDSNLVVLWYLGIEVQRPSGDPASGIHVQLVDEQGEVRTHITAADGRIGPILLKELTKTRYYETYHSPYNITAGNGTAQANDVLHLQGSGNLVMVLKDLDLFVQSLQVNDLEPDVLEWVEITVLVGSTVFPIDGVEIVIEQNDKVYSTSTIDIETGLTEFKIPFSASFPGVYVISVEVDPENKVPEANISNNIANITITVKDGGSNGGGDNDTGKPELHLIGLSQSNDSPFVGSVVIITVEVQNSGSANATDVLVRLYIDGDRIGSKVIPRINAGSLERTTFEWEAAEHGNHTIRVVIDPLDTIEELDETNNVYESQIEVGDTPTGFELFDTMAILCVAVIVIFIIIILVLMVLMARKGKRRAPQAPQQTYGGAGYGQPQYHTSSRTQAIPTQISPREPMVTRGTPRAVSHQTGHAVCKRCGGSNIRFFDDGHKLCKDCRKIFF